MWNSLNVSIEDDTEHKVTLLQTKHKLETDKQIKLQNKY